MIFYLEVYIIWVGVLWKCDRCLMIVILIVLNKIMLYIYVYLYKNKLCMVLDKIFLFDNV